jgi:quercetin 2,3-dioxygenase
MFQVRKAGERGHADHGWLNTYHTFSFADYQSPAHMGFRALRVMNEDRVAPGMGFGTHGHSDMEIVSYVLSGALEHKDSLGNGAVLRPGEFQRISAGTGIRHSEFNPSASEPAHFYQIWLFPKTEGIAPSYEQKRFADDEKQGRLRLVASPSGADGSLSIHQDARIYLATLPAGAAVHHEMTAGRHAWLQVLRGSVTTSGLIGSGLAIAGPAAGGTLLETSDGLALSKEPSLTIAARQAAEIMLFDLA